MKTVVEKYIEDVLIKHIALMLRNNDDVYKLYSMYDGLEDFYKYVLDKINNFEVTYAFTTEEILIKEDEVKNLENIWFKNLHLYIKECRSIFHDSSFYDISHQFNGKKYEDAYIFINYHKKLKQEELLHIFIDIYDEWQNDLHGYDKLSFLDNRSYKEVKEFNKMHEIPTEDRIQRMFHDLESFTKNGLIKNDKRFETLNENTISNDVFNYLSHTKYYYDLVLLGHLLYKYRNDDLSKREKEYISKYYERYYGNNKDVFEYYMKKKLPLYFISTLQRFCYDVIPNIGFQACVKAS